jgi:HAD superfamily hydrolase (TIGR01458 family)
MGLSNIDTIIFDLNGTLYERGIAIKGANDAIRGLRKKGYKLSFITNTDGRSVNAVYESVIKKGLEIERDEIFTPITAVKVFIEENKEKSYYPLVHDDALVDFAHIKKEYNNPDYVIIGDFCDKVSYDEINKVFRMIKNGAEILALSKTLWYIDVDGYSINTGSFVKMFEIACNKEAILMGKPSKDYFNMVLTRTNSKPENTIIVGDDISTDILGAGEINAIGILVKTGVYNEEELHKAYHKPDYIIENINELQYLLNI